jgi:integrase
MTNLSLLDVAGRRRSPATMPGYHAGRPPRNKGMQYPADPPTVDEIVAVMRHTGDNRHGFRLRAIIVVLWRAGLRVQEALALTERDLDPRRGALLVRRGLCRTRHRPRYAERRVMPSRPAGGACVRLAWRVWLVTGSA